MTSYSTYGTGRIQLVDGTLTPDEELRAEQLDQIVQCVASGAGRALLDSTRDLDDPDAEVAAVQWHTEAEGWELDAISDRAPFLDLVRGFVTDNLDDVLLLASRIAWKGNDMWSGDEGMALYRVGYLMGMEGAGQGVGFRDYWSERVLGQLDVTERLSAKLDRRDTYAWEDSWIDSTEEPCLLHLEGS